MNACGFWISLRKIDGVAVWNIRWIRNWETEWKDFYDAMHKIKIILWCGTHFECKWKDCTISRVHKNWERWTLALI